MVTLEGRVFKLDRRIRYCGVLDHYGKILAGGMKPGVRSLEPDEDAERVDLQMVITKGMLEGSHAYLGKTNAIIVQKEKLTLLAFPLHDGTTVLVGAEPGFPLAKAASIRRLVGPY